MYRLFILFVIISMIFCSCSTGSDSGKITLDSTASSVIEDTSVSQDKKNTTNKNDANENKNDTILINEEWIIKLLTMNKEGFIKLLGDEYTLDELDSANSVYNYKEYGIGITYNSDLGKMVKISINDNDLKLFGVNNTMRFSTIKSILGKGELIVDDDYGTFILLYKFDKYKIQFHAVDDPEKVINNGFNIRQP